ncbi:hypothetical protein D9M70_422520 [compost metagenome]
MAGVIKGDPTATVSARLTDAVSDKTEARKNPLARRFFIIFTTPYSAHLTGTGRPTAGASQAGVALTHTLACHSCRREIRLLVTFNDAVLLRLPRESVLDKPGTGVQVVEA